MATASKVCAACKKPFTGRATAKYCSRPCRQSAYRQRQADRPSEPSRRYADEHTPEAVAVLAGLDRELSENAEQIGDALQWSTAEEEIRESIASAIDRRVDLKRRWLASKDDHARVKLSAEWRLTEQEIARLLRQVHTDVPQPLSTRSLKAQRAVNTRWANERARHG